MRILTTAQMHQVEQECARVGLTTDVLMENAGRAVAEEVKRILGDITQHRILFIIGPGNNGGDGLVAARHLHDWGGDVSVSLFSQRPTGDPNLQQLQERDMKVIDVVDEGLVSFDQLLPSTGVVIDALFGTGKIRSIRSLFLQALDSVKRAKKKNPELHIIALDLPSGLDANTGAVDQACLYADYTITLGFPKPGLFISPGVERTGKLTVVDIGIPEYLAEQGAQDAKELITGEWVKSVLPRRPLEANKGSFGKVLVVAGSINYVGAAYLACSGAIRVGAGLVTLATAASLQPMLASKLTEVTYLPLPEARPGLISADAARIIQPELSDYNVMLLGCGLGQSQSAMKLIGSLLFRLKQRPSALVLDADALNTLANLPKWWQQFTDDVILTPHPGEMARLTGLSVEKVQADREAVAKKAAKEWHKTIVLKGAYTVVAAPDGKSAVSPVANPGLASAGTGDVLSGAIAGMVAQGLALFEAAACGVYLHAEAGERVKARLGDAGMIATDLLPELPLAIKQLKEE